MTNSVDILQPNQQQKNPWKAPLRCIFAGMMFQGAALDYTWYFGFLAVFGSALIFWGCHTLRSRHPAFNAAAKFALVYAAIMLLIHLIMALPISQTGILSSSLNGAQLAAIYATFLLIIASTAINILFLLRLRRGVQAEFDRQDMKCNPDIFMGMIITGVLLTVSTWLMIILPLLGLILFMLFAAVCVYSIWLLYKLFQLPKQLVEISPDLEQTLAETRNPTLPMQVVYSLAMAGVAAAALLAVPVVF